MNPPDVSVTAPSTNTSSSADEVSVWEIVAALVAGRRMILRLSVLAGSLAVLIGLLLPRYWIVESSFRPQGADVSLGQLSSLASQFGVNIPGQGDGDTPEFYRELVFSRALLSRVAERTFVVDGNERKSLEELLELDDDNSAVRHADVITWLRESAVSVEIGRQTGVVTIKVRTEWPRVSAELSEALLEELNRFNSNSRRSNATAERMFVEERRDAARIELLQAESALKSFLESNRTWESSPQLRFEQDRRQREVSRRQQLYTSLSEAFEQARIAEVRDTPVITVLQKPYIPPEPERRGIILKLLMGLFFGGGVGVCGAFLGRIEAPQRPEDREAYNQVQAFLENFRRRGRG